MSYRIHLQEVWNLPSLVHKENTLGTYLIANKFPPCHMHGLLDMVDFYKMQYLFIL